jgi:cyanophycinase
MALAKPLYDRTTRRESGLTQPGNHLEGLTMTETKANAPGPLILAGGAEFDDRMAVADRVWLKLLALGMPKLGLLPTANEDRPEIAARNGARHFRRLVTEAEPVMVTTAASAGDPEVVGQIESLDAVYMAGGNPSYLARTLAGSPAWQAIEHRWRKGMGLGGSSAGAMALCEAIYVQERWVDGLSLVRGLVVLPHFNRRDDAAAERIRQVLVARGFIGLGVDESTAAIWHAGTWQAAGLGRVVVLSSDGARAYQAGDKIEALPQPG